MKVTVEIDCTPEEARRFMGLPDLTPLNDHLVEELQKRIDSNMAMLSGDELIKNWMAFGAGAQEQIRRLFDAGLGGVSKG